MPIILIIIIVGLVIWLLIGIASSNAKEREKERKQEAAAKAKAAKESEAKRKREETARKAEQTKRERAEKQEQAQKKREAAEKEKMRAIMEKYRPSFERHGQLVKEIQALYSNSSADPNQEKLISFLKEDIALVPSLLDCNNQLKLAGFDMETDLGMGIEPFSRLADLYESKGQIAQAMSICKEAVALGIDPETNQKHIEILKGKLVRKNG